MRGEADESFAYKTLQELLLSIEEVKHVGPTFLDTNLVEDVWSFARLLQEAKNRASFLREKGIQPGEPVALFLNDAVDFVPAFYGCVLAGIVPIPMAPPASTRGLEGYINRCMQIMRTASCTTILVSTQIAPLLANIQGLQAQRTIDAENLRACRQVGMDFEPYLAEPNSLCFLQFTSGSTAAPKGTVVTHSNILANIKCIMVDGLKADSGRDVGVSWLPLFHDMGLVGFVIAPLLLRIPTVFLPTSAFIRRPALWMTTMDKYRGTISFGPNFAYALAARRAGDVRGLDLSCVRVLGCGAEPIKAQTLDAFISAYRNAGLRSEAIMPAYGMAEATLAVSFDSVDSRFRAMRIDRMTYEHERRAEEAFDATQSTFEVVSCGQPFPGHEIRIVENGRSLGDGRVGEICFRGPSRTPGYVGLEAQDDWLETGDLGFVLDGQLYVCGRKKELIIVRGRKLHPYDIEWEVAKFENIRSDSVAVFSIPGDNAQEEVVIVAEGSTRPADVPVDRIRIHLLDTFQLRVETVLVVHRNTLPKTSSGKLQRAKIRELWLEGFFGTDLRPRPVLNIGD